MRRALISRSPAAFLGLVACLGFAAQAPAQDFLKPADPTPPATTTVTTTTTAASAPADAPKAPAADAAKPAEKAVPKVEHAYFAGGCFWCMEAIFEPIKGVKSVVSGFAGGTVARPSYEAVCTGLTGHAEVVQINFDPALITYRDLVDLFWLAHDPTTLNRQGPDEGTQYRSAIFYDSDAQKKIAQESYQQATSDRMYSSPIVTDLGPLEKFWPADSHHQNYFSRMARSNPYCQAVIVPKIREFKAKLALRTAYREKQSKEKAEQGGK